MRIVVLVLGDLGRSPRMLYHSLSLASISDIESITLIGYEGEKVLAELATHPKVIIKRLKPLKLLDSVPIAAVRSVLKGISLLWGVFFMLIQLERYHAILIQNPPCLPALLVALLVSMFNKSSVIVDWHNLGYTIFQQTLKSRSHPLVYLTKYCEHHLCRRADYHICVSNALKAYLQTNCSISNPIVVHDRPASIFSSSNYSEVARSQRRSFLKSLGISILFDTDKTALIASGTSWTADEDFSILLNALVKLESVLLSQQQSQSQDGSFDSLLCIVTGKGDLKSFYEEKIANLRSCGQLGRKVDIQTAWLALEDYPRLLASADLGISLHASSSGLDLPMKVLDMFGSGIPVLALSFPAISELVLVNENGSLFTTSDELSEKLFQHIFTRTGQLAVDRWRKNVRQTERWDDHWQRTMKPLVLDILKMKTKSS